MSEAHESAAQPAPPSASGPQPSGERAATQRARRSLLARIGEQVRQLGTDAVAVALGRLVETAAAGSAERDSDPSAHEAGLQAARRRVNMLHEVAEKLRGAADEYIAAKLDEIEARVDTKLDEIEQRIDAKINSLDAQLRQMRDQELRHRLRLLKITLIFTVLVALLSLGYKWLTRLMAAGS